MEWYYFTIFGLSLSCIGMACSSTSLAVVGFLLTLVGVIMSSLT